MRDQELARLFFRELEKIDQQEGTTPEKAEAMFQLWLQAIIERTQQERLHFTTLFARLAYAFQRYRIGRNLAYHLHDFRKCQKEGRWQYLEETEQEDRYQRYLLAVAQSFQAFYSASPTPYFVQLFEQPLPEYQLPDYIEGFRKSMRVLVVADDPEKDQLLGREEEAPEELVRIQYNMADRNENFNPGIQTLRRDFSLPLTVQLLDVEIDKNRVLRPRAILLEPDFLVDVSAIAECFKPEGADPIYFLLKKFLPINANKYLLLGNIANFFLDELMSRPEATFNETFGKVFHLSPLAFSLMENAEIREIMDKAKLHFVTLKQIIHQEFSQKEIAPEESFLEPTFYARRYGLQGRLDIFVPKGENPAIIELKSGKAYRPNQYGISSNHYTQTLLYDLMVRAVFKDQPDPINYILYSSLPEKPLRFAPRLASQQMEAMQLRNLLIGIETQLASSYANDPETPLEDSPAARLLRRIHSGFYPQLKGFTMRDIQRFAEAYSSLSRIEQNYFLAFTGFIAREHRLAKTGQEGAGKVSGQAALWLNSPEEKEDAFEILQHLQLKENHAQETVPLLVFHKDPERTNPLANFRTGDIAILYPKPATGDGPLHNHLFKCTLLENTSEKIVVRLRYQQFNDSLFTEDSEWCLEHDVLDSSFNTMYRSLFAFAEGTTEKRELLLGLVPPEEGPAVKIEVPAGMTSEQGSILQKMLATKDYFLLWGPPGTGKTSVMLRNLVEQLLADPKESILVMAYTNRAVDEICESIERISPDIKDQYLRIGSSFSAGAQFQEQMLDRKIANVRSRKEIRELLNRHRLFVGTVSSIAARPELLQLKTFSWAIIDEASQILEPALAGLLVHFQRFVY
jgi:DNA replication ATP-dependent helicase Dna2